MAEPQLLTDVETRELIQSLWQDNGHPLRPGLIHQAYAVESVDSKAMTARFCLASYTPELTRQGNRVQLLPSPLGQGLITSNYAANPVVLYNHGVEISLPIGLSRDEQGAPGVTVTENKAYATVQFSRLPHAEPIFAAVAEGLIRMASIGYLVRKAIKLPPLETQTGVAQPQPGYEFPETELTEWSAVTIGADRQAMRQALDRGKVHDVRLPWWLMQSWLLIADERRVQGIGIDLVRRVVDGVTIEGDAASVDAAERKLTRLEKLAARTTAPEELVDEPAQTPAEIVDEAELVVPTAVDDSCTTPTIAAPTIDLAQVQAIITAAVAPVVADSQALQQRLQQSLGRLS